MKYYAGIDLGGTNIAVGIVDENCNIIGRGKLKTNAPRPAEEIADDMAQATHMAIKDAGITLNDVEYIGIGTPGAVCPETGVIELAANLGFHKVGLTELIKKRIDKPIYIENDANSAALGEASAGAAKGVKNVLMITLGTGVGGGIIIDGKIYAGFNHYGAELGHTGMIYDGWECTCGRKGCIEAYCSATGLIRITKEAMEKDKNSKMWEIVKGDLSAVDGRTSFDAMRAGDKSGKEAVDLYIAYLGYALATYVNIFMPEILVIGGGICKEGETLLAPLREIISRDTFGYDPSKATKMIVATLGNDAGIIGAAMLGR